MLELKKGSKSEKYIYIFIECLQNIELNDNWMYDDSMFCEQTEKTFFYDLDPLLYFLLLYRNCGHPRATQDFYPSFPLNSSK